MKKILYLGKQVVSYRDRPMTVYCKVKFSDGRLSISGVEGPLSNGDCVGGAGQIDMHMDDEYISNMIFADGWDEGVMREFLTVWDEYHLNDMQAGCPHQEQNKPVVKAQAGDSFFNVSNLYDIWTIPLYNRCPECDYKYGTAWLHKEVPEDVLDFLASLPASKTTPAWV